MQWLETPAEIRAVVRFNQTGCYRPWATTVDLPTGWAIPADSARIRAAALLTIYPRLAAMHGTLHPPYEVAQRQQGKYRPVAELSPR